MIYNYQSNICNELAYIITQNFVIFAIIEEWQQFTIINRNFVMINNYVNMLRLFANISHNVAILK